VGEVLVPLGLQLNPDKTRIVCLTRGNGGLRLPGLHCRKVESWRWRGRWYLQHWPSRAMAVIRARIRDATEIGVPGLDLPGTDPRRQELLDRRDVLADGGVEHPVRRPGEDELREQPLLEGPGVLRRCERARGTQIPDDAERHEGSTSEILPKLQMSCGFFGNHEEPSRNETTAWISGKGSLTRHFGPSGARMTFPNCWQSTTETAPATSASVSTVRAKRGFSVRRRDRLGVLIHEYELVA
jgi:hypothetical protein